MSEELKPCPFCGNIPEYNDYVDDDFCISRIICSNCGAQVVRASNTIEDIKPEIITAWNRRAHT